MFVSQTGRMPRYLLKKCSKYSYHEDLNKLSFQEYSEFVDFFMPEIDFGKINFKKSVLLITQPHSEDDIMSEESKIKLYKKIYNEFGDDKFLIIKPHPRERTDYRIYFDNAVVLDPVFPLEVLNGVLTEKIPKGITLYSSSLYNCNFIDEKLFLGIDYDPDVKKVYSNRNFSNYVFPIESK